MQDVAHIHCPINEETKCGGLLLDREIKAVIINSYAFYTLSSKKN